MLVSALDAALGLAKTGRFVLSEALTIRARVRAGRAAAAPVPAAGGHHWPEGTCKERAAEVMARMHGPREPLEALLLG